MAILKEALIAIMAIVALVGSFSAIMFIWCCVDDLRSHIGGH